jgi:hypothetical protein
MGKIIGGIMEVEYIDMPDQNRYVGGQYVGKCDMIKIRVSDSGYGAEKMICPTTPYDVREMIIEKLKSQVINFRDLHKGSKLSDITCSGRYSCD